MPFLSCWLSYLNPGASLDQQRGFTTKGINDRQYANGFSVGQGIVNKVHAPALIRSSRWSWHNADLRATLAQVFPMPQTQAFADIDAVNPFPIHHPALASQQDMNALVSISNAALGDIPDPHPERCIITGAGSVSAARSIQQQKAARTSL